MLRRISFVSLFTLLTLSLHVGAIDEMCSARAEMTVVEARGGFSEVTHVRIILNTTVDETPTSFTLEYGEGNVVELTIQETTHEDNTVQYFAALPNSSPMAERFSIVLTQTESLNGVGRKSWEASVRSGFGWCGTMDSTMSLSGFPIYVNQ